MSKKQTNQQKSSGHIPDHILLADVTPEDVRGLSLIVNSHFYGMSKLPPTKPLAVRVK